MAKEVRFDIIDPRHFHGGLPLQSRYEGVEGLETLSDVYVYYANDNNLGAFEDIITKIRVEDMAWEIHCHQSDDPLEDMLKAGTGNVLIVSCRNVDAINVINQAVTSGNYELILADKPWVIEPKRMPLLEHTLDTAEVEGIILVDLMTERYEFGTIMQKLIMENTDLFGGLVDGTKENPAIFKHSIHILDKGIYRPPDYFDTKVQGEGVPDVGTHLIDMSNWLIRPNSRVFREDVELLTSSHRSTSITEDQLNRITNSQWGDKGNLEYFCNGDLVYTLDNKHISIKVEWKVQGKDDEHYSRIEGKNIIVEVIKGPDDKHQQVYIIPKGSVKDLLPKLRAHSIKLREQGYEGIDYNFEGDRFKLVIPEQYYTSHFQHFEEVTTQALRYLAGQERFLRDIEYSRIFTKYHLTTSALQMARQTNQNQ